MSARAAQRATRDLLQTHNLSIGTALENRITWRLHSWKALDRIQYRVGPYRLDYAWPKEKIALEVDGPHHWRPDVAARDVARDAYLRGENWLVFRIDDSTDNIEDQLLRVVLIACPPPAAPRDTKREAREARKEQRRLAAEEAAMEEFDRLNLALKT